MNRALSPSSYSGTYSRKSRMSRTLAILLVALLVGVLAMPMFAGAAREDTTRITPVDNDGNGKPDGYSVDWDGDGTVDEEWGDPDEDGVIDSVGWNDDGGDDMRSPRGRVGMKVLWTPLHGGGAQGAVDWDGDGKYDEVWWDFDGDGTVDDTDIYETESKVVDNTKATRFRGVFVGVKNGLDYPEKDVDDVTRALENHGPSWDSADMNKLKGPAATPAGIQAAIDAAKADSKPGDEFIFYFSGHGGGWDSEDGELTGGRIDTDGDETANSVPESDFGRFDGSGIPTAAPGFVQVKEYDLDGDGTVDTWVGKDTEDKVKVWRFVGGKWVLAGEDSDGDGDVDGDDGGVDVNGDGDKNDRVGIDDTLLVHGAKVTDDQLRTWLSGFPESVTIVVIIDACHSGSFTNDMQNITDNTGKKLRPGHVEVIAAAPWDEPALERPISNGVLTQAIIDALYVLPSWLTGGHSTSVADYFGNNDDRTTTAELFEWCGPSAVAHLNLDNDGDGLRNEDGVADSVLDTATASVIASGTLPATGGNDLGVTHVPFDDDGDILEDEDPEVPPDSFFDVYYAPDFGKLPTPRLLTCFTGDDDFDVSGFAPDVRVWSDLPLAPGTHATPGPTLQLSVREVPDQVLPPPNTGTGPLNYVSSTYDITLYEIVQTPPLEEMTDTVLPTMTKSEVPPGPLPGFSVSIQPDAGVALGDCVPAQYNEGTGLWEPMLLWDENYDLNTIEFEPEHLSFFTLLSAAPSGDVDLIPPLPTSRLLAQSNGSTVTLAYSNPTDPDWDITRILRSEADFPTSAEPTPGVEIAYEGTQPSAEETLGIGTYYYSAFARDWAGNWSDPATVTLAVTTLLDPCSITGTITAGSSTSTVQASVYKKDGSVWKWDRSTPASLTLGTYEFTGLSPGTYRVGAYDPAGVLSRAYYDGGTTFSQASDIVLAEGQGVSGVGMAMQGYGDFQGTVTSLGTPVAGIDVKFYRWNGSSWAWARDASTDASGAYSATGLREGDYKVSFYDPGGAYIREWHDDVDSIGAATPVALNAGSTVSNLDADLIGYASIGGTLVDSSGTPLPGILAITYEYDGLWTFVQNKYTDMSGNWSFNDLDPGTYRVSFWDPAGNYIREYWQDTTAFSLATDIPLTSGASMMSMDATMAGLGSISGNVTDGTNPVSGISVKAYRDTGSGYRWVRDAVTDGSGNYTLAGLREGDYKLSFYDTGGVYIREWYDDVSSIGPATVLPLSPGTTATNIDAVISDGS